MGNGVSAPQDKQPLRSEHFSREWTFLQRSPIVRVFQISRDLRSFPRLLLWRLPFSLTLSPSPPPPPLLHPYVAAIRRLPLFFFLSLSPPVFLTHPLSLRLPRPTPSSLLLLSRRIVALVGREEKGISRVLEFWWEFVEDGACCDRVSLNFGAGGGEQSCV